MNANTLADLQDAFSKIRFHVSDEDHIYCVASFGSDDTLSALADEFGFDEFHDFEKLDQRGNVQLGDNGAPFTSVNDVIETLFTVFGGAVELGLVTEEQIRSQVVVHPYGVDRSVLT